MKFGRTSFYADENIEEYLINYLRHLNFKVDSARELGLYPRDDRFHLQEAKKRKRVLLTRDLHFLDSRRFPFHDLKNTAIIVLRTEKKEKDFGYMLLVLIGEVGPSGNRNIYGMKMEIRGPRMVCYAKTSGRIRKDLIDISKPIEDRYLFLE